MAKNDLVNKGDFREIDKNFIKDGQKALQDLSKIQMQYNKTDTDTFINELRDSMVGQILGYNYVNSNKHGFDCKKDLAGNEVLEVKNCSFSSTTWGATFNDTTYEKAEAFMNPNLVLALAIWDKAADLLFIAYGSNRKIGLYLKGRIDVFKAGATVRSTQTISLSQLISDYGFKIITSHRSKDEVYNVIIKKIPALKGKIRKEDIRIANI